MTYGWNINQDITLFIMCLGDVDFLEELTTVQGYSCDCPKISGVKRD